MRRTRRLLIGRGTSSYPTTFTCRARQKTWSSGTSLLFFSCPFYSTSLQYHQVNHVARPSTERRANQIPPLLLRRRLGLHPTHRRALRPASTLHHRYILLPNRRARSSTRRARRGRCGRRKQGPGVLGLHVQAVPDIRALDLDAGGGDFLRRSGPASWVWWGGEGCFAGVAGSYFG